MSSDVYHGVVTSRLATEPSAAQAATAEAVTGSVVVTTPFHPIGVPARAPGGGSGGRRLGVAGSAAAPARDNGGMSLWSRLRRLLPTDSRGAPSHRGLRFDYAPRHDGKPDPGEVVWAWVPYDEGDGRGKDRPVLIISRERDELLGLMLTSKDHDRDAANEARWGRFWMDIGSGDWDRRGRPSEVRLDRVLRLRSDAVRREGAALDRTIFLAVADEAQRIQDRSRPQRR